ncbi:hypothetical protein [Halobacterium rubrum]|uniref:hypothetical protein n=1 Tax=Halobacterium TaxID=2239 RepID=UPI001F354D9C|nr:MULTISPECIES: hypothetical protein [Halobacterium]MDH5020388.1 hypothetical protein [Halobacterium rubrum]
MSLPEEFREEFDSKGETFFQIAETLYENHGDQFTLSDLADEVGLSKSRVSTHLEEPQEGDWVSKNSGDTTYVWNTEKYNPIEIETTDAVFGLYTDLWEVLKRHSRATTGTPAIAGLVLFITAGMMWFLYFGFSVGLFQESVIPITGYFGVGLVLFITGVAVTLLSPTMAIANRAILKIYQVLKNS